MNTVPRGVATMPRGGAGLLDKAGLGLLPASPELSCVAPAAQWVWAPSHAHSSVNSGTGWQAERHTPVLILCLIPCSGETEDMRQGFPEHHGF